MSELLTTINTEAFGTFTDKQLLKFCSQNSDLRIERNNKGQLIIKSPTFSLTAHYNANILAEIVYWNNQTKSGVVFDSNGGFTLPDNAMRAADVAWIEKKRWDAVPENDKKSFSHICPDFVIELKSETDSLKILKQKMQEWIRNGCHLGWLIDTAGRKTYIYKPNSAIKMVSFDKKLSGENVLPGFEMNLNSVLNL